MSLPWTKFFWCDWESDPALRLCSYAAQGLWMRMLCIAAAHDPIGYVAVAGRGLDETSLARMTGGTESEVASLLGELDRNGVFSRDRHRRIYSRRMVRDARKASEARKNGKLGGNPSLGKDKGISDWDKGSVKGGLKPQKPEARSQTPERTNTETTETQQNGQAVLKATRLEPDWQADSELIIYAIKAGMTETEAFRASEDFRDYWTAKSGADARKLDWPATWRRWVRTAIDRRKTFQKPPQKRVAFV